MCRKKPWKLEWILNWNIYEMHTWLAEDFDYQRLKADLRKGSNVKRL